MEKYERTIDVNKPYSLSYFCNFLEEAIKQFSTDEYSDIVFVCIGTDRATGDCLGPLVGYKIQDIRYDKVHVYGTLDEPVHAKNLEEYLEKLRFFKKPFVIAIDACLGRLERIGSISIREGPLEPGSGVNKQLTPVGNINITGIVNVGGFMELMILQNTRLSLVMSLANVIANGIKYVLWKLNRRGEQDVFEESAIGTDRETREDSDGIRTGVLETDPTSYGEWDYGPDCSR